MDLVRCLIFASFAALCKSCANNGQLPDLVRRSREYVSVDEPPVDDLLLDAGWYTTSVDTVQYRMTDSTNVPPLDGCGTVEQIYLQGTHPTGITGTSVTVTACIKSFFSDCLSTTTVEIRNCSGIIQYYLVATGQLQAYCFDPLVAQQNTEAPDFNAGDVTIQPELAWTSKTISTYIYNIPALVFKCSFQQSPGLFYTVSWYVNGHLQFTFGPTTDVDSLHLHQSVLTNNGYSLGINLQCSVTAAAASTGSQTLPTFSDDFYAGIQVLNPNLVLPGDDAVRFRSTVPIGCVHKDGATTCSSQLYVQMSNPNFTCEADYVMTFQRCSRAMELMMKDDTWNQSATYDFKLTSNFKTIEPVQYNLFLQTSSTDSFYTDHRLQAITATVSNGRNFLPRLCYSHVDPHMKTFDINVGYENQRPGDFVLYRNTMYGIEVQERTMSCGSAQCTCQVAVRAGGDVFVINRCSGTTKFNEFVLCNDGGILDVVKERDSLYKVYTSIGTIINVRVMYRVYMNVDIYSSPKDVNNVEGLCGNYDGNHSNDFRMRNGSLATFLNTDYEFSEDWRVKEKEGLLTGYTLDHVTTWIESNTLLCICNQSDPFLEGRPQQLDEAFCGAHEFEECFHPLSITDRKCSKQHARKRRAITSAPFYQINFKNNKNDDSSSLQKRSSETDITVENTTTYCSDIINNSPAVRLFPDRLMNIDIDNVIDQCVFDVVASDGDLSFAENHAASLAEVVKQTFQYEPTFTSNNTDLIASFLQQTCPNHCSGRGICSSEGNCECENGYHGSECSVYEGNPINIDSLEEDGICYATLEGDCSSCFWFRTENLLENFSCKFIYFMIGSNGTKTYIDEYTVLGEYDDMYSGQCCLPSMRKKRSTESPGLGYEWEMFISNDGTAYGSGTSLYVLEQTCATVTTDSSTNIRTLDVKDGFCFIDFGCLTDSEKKETDPCQACSANVNKYSWTDVCSTSEEHSRSRLLVVAVSVGGGLVFILIGGLIIFCICKSSNKHRISTLQQTPIVSSNANHKFSMTRTGKTSKPSDHSMSRKCNEAMVVPAPFGSELGQKHGFYDNGDVPSRAQSVSGISVIMNYDQDDF